MALEFNLCQEPACVKPPISNAGVVRDERERYCPEHAEQHGLAVPGLRTAVPPSAPAIATVTPVFTNKHNRLKRRVIVRNVVTNKETNHESISAAAKAIGGLAGNVSNAIKKGGVCKGHIIRYADAPIPCVQAPAETPRRSYTRHVVALQQPSLATARLTVAEVLDQDLAAAQKVLDEINVLWADVVGRRRVAVEKIDYIQSIITRTRTI